MKIYFKIIVKLSSYSPQWSYKPHLTAPCRLFGRTMSIFTSKFDSISGKTEWMLMDDAFDYSQQIARSAYADMLHDTDRNVKYYEALKIAISKLQYAGKKAIVLDIGTGTGILSMMAASCGADAVYACEFFGPMSECAQKIIALNGYQDQIKVIHKGSTQLTVGPNGDLPCRANILVTEVFDTELIGEGAVKTFTHAQEKLLEKDAIVIPSVGRVYAAVFESNLVNAFNKVDDLFCDADGCSVKIPKLIKDCYGSASVHDLQISELPESSFKLLSAPEIVFDFDWTGKKPIIAKETKFHQLKALSAGTAHGVFMWWDLIMDCDGKILLSCAPKWAESVVDYAWRDHWMQAVYYFPKSVSLEKNQDVTLVANHDEFSLWFDLNLKNERRAEYEVPVCECGLHLTSRMRVGMINDRNRQSKYMRVLKPLLSENTVALCLSECSFLGHYLASKSVKKVYSYETNRFILNVLSNVAKFNNIHEKIRFESTSDNLKESIQNNNDSISLIVAEPFFSSSILPWHNLQFWYIIDRLREILPNDIRIVPSAAEFYIMAVQFQDLWKIRAPVMSVEGFSLKPFDEIIQEAIEITDDVIDAQPLWEYPCVALSKPVKFMNLNFIDNLPRNEILCIDKFKFETTGTCNGLVLWVDWILSEDGSTKISSGPVRDVICGQTVTWDMFSKQGVYFFKNATSVSPTDYLSYSIRFHVAKGSFEYLFNML